MELVLPVVHGHRQPLAASYRTSLGRPARAWWRRADCARGCCWSTPGAGSLHEVELLAGAELSAADPGLRSVVGVNTPGEYAEALARQR